jgi:hypothetical protein
LASKQSIAKAGTQADPGSSFPSQFNQVTFPAQLHALPFRTVLGEYYARRPRDLARVAAAVGHVQTPPPYDPKDIVSQAQWDQFADEQWVALLRLIETSESAYRELTHQKEEIAELSVKKVSKLAIEHQNRINKLQKEVEDLADEIRSALPDQRQGLESKKNSVETRFWQENRKNEEDERQTQIAEKYQDVLAAEKQCKVADWPLLRVLHGMNGSAVCLSGGGIRSASFCLGVLQGLARFSTQRKANPDLRPSLEGLARSAMAGLDYLSTVSGGGYIGSWLMAWASRANYQEVIKLLAHPGNTATDPEPQPIRHLREYTSYLSPRYGFTLDTMTLLAIVVRNLLLNWMILVPALVFLFCLPEFVYHASAALVLRSWPMFPKFSLALATILQCVALVFIAIKNFKPYYASETTHEQQLGRTSREVLWVVAPFMAGAWILGQGWAWAVEQHLPFATGTLTDAARYFAPFAIFPPLLMAFLRVALVWPRMDPSNDSPLRRHAAGAPGDIPWQPPDSARGAQPPIYLRAWRWGKIVDWTNVFWAFGAPLLIGMAIAFALAASARYIPMPATWAVPKTNPQVTRMFVWLCLPVVWSVLLLASAFLSGLLSGIEQEEEREWWARASGLLMMAELAWIGLLGLAFFAGVVVSAVTAGALAAFGLASGYAGSLAGLSAATSSGLKKIKLDQLSGPQKWLAKHDLLAPAACAIAVICLSLALAAATSWARGGVYKLWRDSYKSSAAITDPNIPAAKPASKPGGIPWAIPHALFAFHSSAESSQPSSEARDFKTDVVATSIVALCALFVAALANLLVNVNTFSLHGMYRMRLTRAYLGASNFARHPDNFTNFDKRDNLHEADVAHRNAPLHVINTALNLVATTNLAWQQRKAESFTFSPLNAGSWRLGYVPTVLYGGSKGVTLGTAMSISGAAFNPNMGYHSSSLVTLLMTFFNARLGWWLPNPNWPVLETKRSNGRAPSDLESLLKSGTAGGLSSREIRKFSRYLHRAGPKYALFTLIFEALGRTDDKYKWIELTDGGHFENLGLYEMVMRRCRFIVLVDADADNDYEFEDLGNAARKIEIDFGIPVRFPKYPKGLPMKHGVDGANVYYALGEILYDCIDRDPNRDPDRDGDEREIQNGKLLYIKPCLNGSEPVGIKAYANSHTTFPHESTLNQFFNEAQFESYRTLGSWEFASIVREFSGTPLPPGNDVQSLFDCISSTTDSGLWPRMKHALESLQYAHTQPLQPQPTAPPDPSGGGKTQP